MAALEQCAGGRVDRSCSENDELKIDGNLAVCWSSNLDYSGENNKDAVGSAVSGEGLVNVYRGNRQGSDVSGCTDIITLRQRYQKQVQRQQPRTATHSANRQTVCVCRAAIAYNQQKMEETTYAKERTRSSSYTDLPQIMMKTDEEHYITMPEIKRPLQV